MAYDPAKAEIFVANFDNNTVSVISDSINSIVATIKVGSQPDALAYDSANGDVYVANENTSSVSVISDTSNTLVANVTVGNKPQAVVYDSGRGEIFVAGWSPGGGAVPSRILLSVISDADNAVVQTVNYVGTSKPGLNFPGGLAYDSAKGEIFAFDGAGYVGVISDTNNTVVGNIKVPLSGPLPQAYGDLAYDHSKGEVFVTGDNQTTGVPSAASDTVYVISDSTNSIVGNVTVGKDPDGIAYDSGKGEVYVANYNASSVSVISDTNNSVVATLPVGIAPLSMTYDQAKAEVFVGNVASGTISIISDAGSGITSAAPEFPAAGLVPATFLLLSLCGLLFRGKTAKSRSTREGTSPGGAMNP